MNLFSSLLKRRRSHKFGSVSLTQTDETNPGTPSFGHRRENETQLSVENLHGLTRMLYLYGKGGSANRLVESDLSLSRTEGKRWTLVYCCCKLCFPDERKSHSVDTLVGTKCEVWVMKYFVPERSRGSHLSPKK